MSKKAQRKRGGAREWTVLAAGALSSAALLGAALLALEDPAVLGRATVARIAGTVSDGLAQEWERIARGDELFSEPSERVFRWAEADRGPLAPSAPARDLLSDRAHEYQAFDLLFAEARRNEAQGELAAARDLLRDAADTEHDRARAAELHFARVRVSAGEGRPTEVAHAWADLAALCDGLDARGDTAYLVLAALAALPVLGRAERDAVLATVGNAWALGELALPDSPADARAPWHGPAPLRAAMRAELERFGDLPEGVERFESRRRLRLLAEAFGGELPVPSAESAPVGALATAAADGLTWLLLHRADPGRPDARVARLITRDDLERLLRTSADAHDLVPDGFLLDFGAERRGEAVRERTPLLGPDFGFALRHRDPGEIIAAESVRLAFLQVGLIVMAVLVATATAFTWRALRREGRLTELKAAFIANVSHELRTPLSSILLMAENLELGRVPDDAAKARYHRLIRREAGRLRRLVDDVLDFSALDRGQRPRLRADDVDLSALAVSLEEEAREAVEACGGKLEFQAGDIPGKMLADGEALRRAVMNLVDNALKHSGGTDVTLRIGGALDELILSVRDRGRGVEAERREQIFQPFARLKEGSDAPPGAGLGLSIVREIAEAHGGSARVRPPANGPGAVFELRLPRGGRGGAA
ncbi:MAG: HAMP domain-containing sensor histidine kinase [Planctomycetota bacterium]